MKFEFIDINTEEINNWLKSEDLQFFLRTSNGSQAPQLSFYDDIEYPNGNYNFEVDDLVFTDAFIEKTHQNNKFHYISNYYYVWRKLNME